MIRYNQETRTFGVKSKILGALSPGAWQAKEAAKYGYDKDEYRKKRWKYALKGVLTPLTSTIINEKVKKMYESGASQDEIRNYLENKGKGKWKRRLGGTLEAVTLPLTQGLNATAATYKSLYDVWTKRRMKSNKKN